jgi:ribA/ribD-fused uncharacterized protein
MNNINLKPIVVGDVDWMRNDYVSSITIGGITYPTLEHAYQGLKFGGFNNQEKDVQRSIANALTVREARKIGRKTSGVRENWDDIKVSVMLNILRKKFQDPILADRLIKTGSAPIVMSGYDTFWGTGEDGDGENALGMALETVRFELQLENGVNPEDYDPKDDNKDKVDKDEKPKTLNSLSAAILEDGGRWPSKELADACQDLFDGSVALLTLVDSRDFDASFISRRTEVSIEQAEAAIKKLQSWQSAVNTLNDLLGDNSGDNPTFVSEDDEDEDEDEDEDDDWLD